MTNSRDFFVKGRRFSDGYTKTSVVNTILFATEGFICACIF